MSFELLVYTLVIVRCLADFDESFLFCQNSPPKLPDGLIKRDRVSFYAGQGYLGNMEYMCLPTHNLIGNPIVNCETGQWSSMPQCISKRRCSPIRLYPMNTRIHSNDITLFQNDPQQIIVGSTITLQCMDNYEYDSTSNGSLAIQCQNDGSWSPMPRCRHAQVTCDYSNLYLPFRSRITRMNFQFSDLNRQFHTVGSYLEYTCEEGYRLKDGKTSLIVQCLNSGSWSSLPVCEQAQPIVSSPRCHYPRDLLNGFIATYNVTIWEDQTYTGQILYECHYGYEVSEGNSQILSDCVNGAWTNLVHCQEIPRCLKQELLEIESHVDNSYVYNVSLQYIRDPLAFVYKSYVLRVCLPNFEHDPSSPPLKIQCQRSTKTWTGVPICRAIQTTTTKIDVVSVTTPAILPEERTESPTETLDSSDILVCHSNDIPNVLREDLNTTYAIGTTLSVRCQSGYESRSNQSEVILCSMNGTWLINTTLCQSKLSPVGNETSTSSPETTGVNNLDDDLPIMNITNDTILSLSTSHRYIRQIISSCKELPQIEHARLISDETIQVNVNRQIMLSGSVSFICQVGFRNDRNESEPFRLTCQDGIFGPQSNCIEQSRCSLPPPIDSTSSSIIHSSIRVFDTSGKEAIPGSFVLLHCPATNSDQNSLFNLTCLENGQWSTPSQSCKPPFKRRCQMEITIPNARIQIYAQTTTDGSYDDGSRVTYRCLENFIHDRHSGPLFIQCRHGRWGRRPRCIPNGCLQPLPDTIANGWKSAQSYFVYDNVTYYSLTRYSCHENAILVGSTSHSIDIQCRHTHWEYKSFPQCQLKESEKNFSVLK